MAYDTTEAVAKFLSGFQMKITNRERDTVAPGYYVKYSLTLSKGGKDFSTTFVSDGEPTVTQVFSALADDALTLRKYSTDEFVDKLYAQGVKPSAALRAYDSCKETNLWMQDELYLSGWEIEEISKILTKYEDEVNTLVEKAASERAARYAYDHPKLPKGFVTIEQLQGDLDLGDLRDEVEDFDFDGDITEAFGETAEYKVDDNYHALLTWLPDHTEWLEEETTSPMMRIMRRPMTRRIPSSRLSMPRSRRNMAKTSPKSRPTLDRISTISQVAQTLTS